MEPIDRLPAHWPYDVSRRDAARVLGEVERWRHIDGDRVASRLGMDVDVVQDCLFALCRCGLLDGFGIFPRSAHGWSAIPVRGDIHPSERSPRASTIRLRARLREDRGRGELHDNPHYVRWLMDIDPGVGLAVARQTVYRERKRLP